MALNSYKLLKNSLTIDQAINAISKLEATDNKLSSNSFVKWKSYSHQVVVESESYFYKVYEESVDSIGPFNSLIRNALAVEYKELGLNWQITSFQRGSSIFDFEQRQKLHVATQLDMPFSKLLLSFSTLLDSVEEQLEFDSILKQLKSYSCFAEVHKLKLVRVCVNKFEDYAIFNGQAILLDDADWCIVPVSANGSVLTFPNAIEAVPICTSYGNFYFLNNFETMKTSLHDYSSPNLLNSVTHGWYLFTKCPSSHANGTHIVESSSSCKNLDTKPGFAQSNVLSKSRSIEHCENSLYTNKFIVSKLKEDDFMPSSKPLSEDDLLYMNNVGRKSFQWELWQCCNNLCPFCYLGTDNRHTDKSRQLKSLSDLKKALQTLDFKVYNNVSIIGGEFFQGQLADPEVSDSFFELIHMLAKLYKNKKLGSIWITATLTLGDQADLYKMLDIFEEAGVRPHPSYGASGVWICTSWDAQGRFKTEDRRKNWEYHMQNIGAYYPWVKKNTTIILTQKLCEMYLESKYDPKVFTGKFNTCLFYKQPGMFQLQPDSDISEFSITPQDNPEKINAYLARQKQMIEDHLGFRFYPDRRTFRKFLLKYAKQDLETFDRLFNIEYRADELHRNFNEIDTEQPIARDKTSNLESSATTESIVNPNCKIKDDRYKHIINYSTYSDSNDCMICDRNQILEAVKKGNK